MRSSHEPLKARMLHQNLSEHSNIKEPQLTKYVNQQNIRLILGIRSGFLEPKLASKQIQHTKKDFVVQTMEHSYDKQKIYVLGNDKTNKKFARKQDPNGES